jgi:hypothetical protein
LTSRFGVAGTLLGAAVTAMLVTGGSAILRAYLETLSGHVRGMPKKLRSRRDQQAPTMPGRPELRDNFVGRMRAALGWFSNLPTLRRRSILMKGLLAAVVAFLLCMGLVWGTEKVIGNSLSCGLWAECPYGATPGIHPMGIGGTGAGSSLSGGSMSTSGAGPLDRIRQNAGNPFGGDQPDFGNPGGGAAPSASPKPAASPEPAGGNGSASPAAGQGADSGSTASPAAVPKKKAAPSTASPAAGQ